MNFVRDPGTLQILWSRLIGITQEMFTTVWRTAFTPVVAIIQDHGCAVMDEDGNCLAHAPASMPAFNLTMPLVTRAVLRRFPAETMSPGDVYVTNDPWLSAGHLNDICAITPLFRNGRVVAFCGTIAHANDIGGTNDDRRPRSLYEEGLQISISKLYDRGCRNEVLWDIIRANVREPDEVLGDIEALVTANAVGVRELARLMDEHGLDDLRDLSSEIRLRTRNAVEAVIREIPDGAYSAEIQYDGFDEVLMLRVTVYVEGTRLRVDYTGSAGQVEAGINCTLAYTRAQTFYSLMCALTPELPNNEGSLEPFSIHAPEGSILNCRFPAPVNLRLRTGWHINTVLYRALAPVLGDRVMAGCGFLAAFMARGTCGGRPFSIPFFAGGGQGASRGRDGRPGYIFPSTAAGMSVERFESLAPLVIERKELLTDSGGAGRWRGGVGQRIEVGLVPGQNEPVEILLTPDRMLCPAPGLDGGQAGGSCRVLLNGIPLAADSTFYTHGYVVLGTAGNRLLWDLPGGGGYGDPKLRDRRAVARDVALGLVSEDAARELYGWELSGRDN